MQSSTSHLPPITPRPYLLPTHRHATNKQPGRPQSRPPSGPPSCSLALHLNCNLSANSPSYIMPQHKPRYTQAPDGSCQPHPAHPINPAVRFGNEGASQGAFKATVPTRSPGTYRPSQSANGGKLSEAFHWQIPKDWNFNGRVMSS